ncbi:MAG: winged helix-turn-helix transcriptional regulator [DPANN group archaeon]|nr:winged helix-turn-helix transcriptional regulator [DPANN group archaeon]
MVEDNNRADKAKRKCKAKTSAKSVKLVLKIPTKENDFESKPHIDVVYKQPEMSNSSNTKVLTAHDILTKTPEELDQGRRELNNLVRRMKILTAIMLGNHQNKELSKILDTDKSFTSKQIRELENEGLIKRETDGREVKYEVDKFNLLKFLNTKVAIKWKKEDEDKK